MAATVGDPGQRQSRSRVA